MGAHISGKIGEDPQVVFSLVDNKPFNDHSESKDFWTNFVEALNVLKSD